MPPFVILDRDGVINEDSPNYIKNADEWIAVPGSLDAIARLHQSGYQVFVATNQAGINRGILTLEDLESIHRKMHNEVNAAGGKITAVEFCPHHPDDNCRCRKPKPGLLNNLAKAHDLDLATGYFVGDSSKDLQAADAAGCPGILVLSGNGRQTLGQHPGYESVFENLASFVDTLLA